MIYFDIFVSVWLLYKLFKKQCNINKTCPTFKTINRKHNIIKIYLYIHICMHIFKYTCICTYFEIIRISVHISIHFSIHNYIFYKYFQAFLFFILYLFIFLIYFLKYCIYFYICSHMYFEIVTNSRIIISKCLNFIGRNFKLV